MSDLGNKIVFASNLKQYMDRANIDRNRLCEDLGFKYSTVSEWLAGKKYPRIDKIEMLANYFGIQKSDLIEREHTSSLPDNIIPMPKMKRIPLLGNIACGEPILAVENLDGDVTIPENIHADFALRCKGDSMVDARILDGDIAYIREQPTVENGEIAAVLIGDEATLKRVYMADNTLTLMPANAAYQPIVFVGEDINNVRILGKAVAFTSTVK